MKLVSFDMGIRNFCWCVIETTTGADGCGSHLEGGAATAPTTPPAGASDPLARVCSWEVIDLLADNGVNRKAYTIELATAWLVQSMQKRQAALEGVEAAVIEQQPTGRQSNNIKMKVLSHVLQAWLQVALPTARVSFFNPQNKFRALAAAAAARGSEAGGGSGSASQRYQRRKKIGVAAATHCLSVCVVPPGLREWYGALKKKDDAADAFIQGLFALAPVWPRLSAHLAAES